jgi:hypothetical protein
LPLPEPPEMTVRLPAAIFRLIPAKTG